MIEKQCAIEARSLALAAIEDLSLLLKISQDRCSADRYEQIKEGVGRSIGEIQMGVLEVISMEFPELDDLTGKS